MHIIYSLFSLTCYSMHGIERSNSYSVFVTICRRTDQNDLHKTDGGIYIFIRGVYGMLFMIHSQ